MDKDRPTLQRRFTSRKTDKKQGNQKTNIEFIHGILGHREFHFVEPKKRSHSARVAITGTYGSDITVLIAFATGAFQGTSSRITLLGTSAAIALNIASSRVADLRAIASYATKITCSSVAGLGASAIITGKITLTIRAGLFAIVARAPFGFLHCVGAFLLCIFAGISDRFFLIIRPLFTTTNKRAADEKNQETSK